MGQPREVAIPIGESNHYAAHPDARRVVQLVRGFRVAVHDDPARVDATGEPERQLAAAQMLGLGSRRYDLVEV